MASNNNDKIKKLVSKVVDLQELSKKVNEQYNEARSILQDHFDKNNLKDFEVDTDLKSYRVLLVERVSINFFPDRLKKKLSKELFNEVAVKKYEVVNMNRLIKLFKEYDIPKEELKECINSSITIDKDKMKQMSSLGDIKLDDIEGCYSATISKHIQIKEKK